MNVGYTYLKVIDRGLPFAGLQVECKSSQRTAAFLHLPFLLRPLPRTDHHCLPAHEDSGVSLSLERGGRRREGGRENGREREGDIHKGEGEVIGFHTNIPTRPNFTKQLLPPKL